ncbi:MAG: 8-oxoguanine DNA glycosylase, N-terminal domain-containing protein [Clostridia bacterium]|nr:8-oxoguanine DNA glycosylase, N-terminal domain-containing protein [Clostridia bacterium]
MDKIVYNSEYFSPKDTLNCGQVFRFFEYKKGYIVLSKDKACYLYCENDKTIIECEDNDKNYFYNYFDLNRDYSKIVESAKKENEFLSNCAIN